MNCIVLEYKPFELQSKAVVISGDLPFKVIDIPSDINTMGQKIIDFAYANNIYSLRISCPIALYSEIENAILQDEQRMFSRNRLEIKKFGE